jgi:hypothetical protein
MFKNYSALLDKYYNNFKTRKVQNNHDFHVDNQESYLNMKCATHDGVEFVLQPVIKRGTKLCDARTKEIQEFRLENLKPPGLRPLKQVELYKKFRPCVSRQYWEEISPKPKEEVMEHVRNERSDRRKTKNSNSAENNVTKE